MAILCGWKWKIQITPNYHFFASKFQNQKFKIPKFTLTYRPNLNHAAGQKFVIWKRWYCCKNHLFIYCLFLVKTYSLRISFASTMPLPLSSYALCFPSGETILLNFPSSPIHVYSNPSKELYVVIFIPFGKSFLGEDW